MNRLLFSILVLTIVAVSVTSAQPTGTPVSLTSVRDSLSYSAGLQFGMILLQQRTSVHNPTVIQGVTDAADGKGPVIEPAAMDRLITNLQKRASALMSSEHATEEQISQLFGTVSSSDQPAMKSFNDSLSYTLGFQFGYGLFARGLEIDPTVVASGLAAATAASEPAIDREAFTRYAKILTPARRVLDELTDPRELAFFQQILSDTATQALPNGVFYQIIERGTGSVVNPTDSIRIHFVAANLDEEPTINSYEKGGPIATTVAGMNMVIRPVLEQMNAGEKVRIFVPSVIVAEARPRGGPVAAKAQIISIEMVSIQPN